MPYSAEALKNLAKLYFSNNEYVRSAALFRQLLVMVPYDYEAKFLLEESMKEKTALAGIPTPELTKELVENINPFYKYTFKTDFRYAAKSINFQALSLVRDGRFVEASTLLRRFIELNDSSPTLSYNLAKLYFIQNRHKEALEYAWKTAEMDPRFKDAYDLVGSIFFKFHDFQNSLRFYEKVVEFDPEDAMGYYNLGHVFHTTGNFQKAEENFMLAIEKEERQHEKESEESSEEKLDISLIVETRPIAFEAHKSLGLLYVDQEKKAQALEQFKRAVDLEPSDPEPYYEIGRIYLELGDEKRAQFYLDKYIYLGGSEEKVKKIKRIGPLSYSNSSSSAGP
jgi:tetratricopeptide (TPR) repeat protein